MALGQAPFSLPVLVFAGFPLLCILLGRAPGLRRAAWIGLVAGTGYFATSLHWIVEPFLIDIPRHGWMAPFALVFMSVGLALFWMGAALVARRFAAGLPLALAAALTLAEFLRAQILTGFPWAMISHAWAETSVIQLASLTGAHGLTLLTLATAGLLALRRPLPAMLAVVLVGAGWTFGWNRLNAELPRRDTPVLVRLIQPNAPQDQKWRPEMAAVFYERQLRLTAAGGGPRPDITLWPEAAVPFLMHDRPDLQANIAGIAGPGTTVILGIRRVDEARRWYNSLAVLGPDGAVLAAYDKHHLVPFGEYIPFSDFFRQFGITSLAGQSLNGFSPGSGPARIDTTPAPPFIPLICYEMIFPGEIRQAQRPEWLVHLTNDAWFGAFSGPYQHLAQTRLRAIEFGLPVARSANTGISAMIDPMGRITASLPLNEEGYLDALLPSALPPTLYSRTGDWPSVLAALALFGICVVRTRRQG